MSGHTKGKVDVIWLVHFFDQNNYEFCMSLHTTRAAAEAAVDDLLRHFDIKESMEPNPTTRDELFDSCGEGVQLYRITCDGDPAEKISYRRACGGLNAN